MSTDEPGSGNVTSRTLDLITQEITNRERDRILALVDAEIKDWGENGREYGNSTFCGGANQALQVLRSIIVRAK